MQITERPLDTPFRVARRLLTSSRKLGAISISYHYSLEFSETGPERPYIHFLNGRRFVRENVEAEQLAALRQCHDFLMDHGSPILVSKTLDLFKAAEPERTVSTWALVNGMGVHDAFMVPVFGPHQINGVIAFGFGSIVDDPKAPHLADLEQLAVYCHNRMVRNFEKGGRKTELSDREKEVLNWVARGKSNSEIAIILGIGSSSIDTYTRRIFTKMNVHDRVSAAVDGIVNGLIKLP